MLLDSCFLPKYATSKKDRHEKVFFMFGGAVALERFKMGSSWSHCLSSCVAGYGIFIGSTEPAPEMRAFCESEIQKTRKRGVQVSRAAI